MSKRIDSGMLNLNLRYPPPQILSRACTIVIILSDLIIPVGMVVKFINM